MSAERISRVVGTALPIPGDNIDTDRIIPARFLKSVSFEGLEDHLFEDDRAQLAARGGLHPIDDTRFAGATVLLVDANFGCGSSREHAPQAIKRRGVRAVIGQSFSEIFFGNSVALGLPCVTVDAAAADALRQIAARNPSAVFDVDLANQRVTVDQSAWPLTMPASARDAFLTGSWDATGMLLDDYGAVEAVAARLPYMKWSALTP
jgi:3-isopropylmalate/(R)-2-methylmalate dehydratase small subunit